MENVKTAYDLAAVVAFLGIAITPRAIRTYFALRQEKKLNELAWRPSSIRAVATVLMETQKEGIEIWNH
jgi:hypothetical protein